MSEIQSLLNEARSHLGMNGRPNAATRWYADRHGIDFLRAPWCDMWISWLAHKTGLGKKVGEFAYCPWHINWFKKNGRWGDKPKVGAIVFFDWDKDKVADHVGIVESHSEGRIVTLEGNTSDRSARRVRYPWQIIGYGYPEYATAVKNPNPYPGRLIRKGSKGSAVVKVQKALIAKGHKLPRYGADGEFGLETERAVKAFQRKVKITADGIVGPITWGKLFK